MVLLSRPIVTTPGSTFSYNTASAYLLGMVFYEATGMTLAEFADERLFNELAFFESDRKYFSETEINGGAGIELRPVDMAKLGQLYMQGGQSGNQQLIASHWVDYSIRPAYEWRFDHGALTDATYGQLWWVDKSATDPAFLAWGYARQFIYVVPGKNLVIVTTTDRVNAAAAGGSDFLEMETLDIIINQIVPGVQ